MKKTTLILAAFMLLGVYSIAQVNLQNGLVGYWPFNGNANDESGNGYHGIVNGANLTTDRFGNENFAYSFNGNDQYIELANTSDLNMFSGFSLVAWVNFTASNGSSIISKHINYYYNGFTLSADNNHANLTTNNNQYYLATEETYNDGEWHMFVGTLNGNSMSIYVDGMLKATGSTDYTIGNDMNIRIGADSMISFFDGKIDDVRIYSRLLNAQEIQALYNDNAVISITTLDITAMNSSVFEIPVNIDGLNSDQNIISFQFNFHYDDYVLKYEDCIIQGTLAENGSIQVNNMSNKLSIAWAGQTPLAGSGTLLKLRFKALHEESFQPFITDCLINTDTIRNVSNGLITITSNLGDVDDNGSIQAYDAAIALQYSVGLDPLPDIDPLPWENWRLTTADVDGQPGITAYDASLMLQYTVGLINSFPAGGSKKSAGGSPADIIISTENGYIVFRSTGDLKGLNLTIEGNPELLGDPQVVDTNMLMAKNISSSVYSVGLATARSPEENEIIMKIPLTEPSFQSLMLNLTVNNQKKQVNLLIPVSSPEIPDRNIEMYPNPANTTLYFRNLSGQTSIFVYDLQGREIIAETITNNQIDISLLDHGIYTIRIEDGKNVKIGKLIKQ